MGRPFHSLRVFATIGLITGSIQPVHAQQLAPSTAWQIDFAKDSCALQRQFGTGGQMVQLELAQFQPGRDFVITIAGKSLALINEVAEYRFYPAAHPSRPFSSSRADFGNGYIGLTFEAGLQAADRPDTEIVDQALIASGEAKRTTEAQESNKETRENSKYGEISVPFEEQLADSDYEARAKSITALIIEKALEQPLTLVTGAMDQPIKAMQECMDHLMLTWGLKRDPEGNWPTMASIKNIRIFARVVQRNYPLDALRDGVSATVRVRVMVDTKGKPASCHTQLPVRYESFEKTICSAVMRRARFYVTYDSTGNAVRSYFVTKVSYQLN